MGGRLGDDGTMDTVIGCDACGAQTRYNYDPGPPDDDGEVQSYDEFVRWAIEDFDETHVCGEGQESEESEDL